MEGQEQRGKKDRRGREMGVLYWLNTPRVRHFLKPLFEHRPPQFSLECEKLRHVFKADNLVRILLPELLVESRAFASNHNHLSTSM